MELQSEKIDLIIPALIAARAKFAAAVKDGKNPHFNSKYVTLDGAISAINPALLEAGIFAVQQTDVGEKGIVLYTRFMHASGQWIGSAYPVHPVKNDPQGEGSALTYARRYALMALAGIAPEDDDGNAATKAAERDNTADDTSTNEWVDALAGAESLAALDSLAKELATSGISAAGKTKARAAYSAAKHKLAKAA